MESAVKHAAIKLTAIVDPGILVGQLAVFLNTHKLVIFNLSYS